MNERKETSSIIKHGYQPENDVDTNNPPQGTFSGIRWNVMEKHMNEGKETEPTNISFDSVASKIIKMLEAKNHDYGDRNLEVFGMFGIAARLMDKVMRLANVSLNGNMADETVEDTLTDIAGYAILALKLLEEGRLKPMGWFTKIK